MIEERPLPWQELLEIFFRRKWLIGATGVVGLVLAVGVALTTPSVYIARAQILLTEQALPGPREEAMSDSKIKAELHHLKNQSLIRSVLEFYQETSQPLRPDPPPIQRHIQGVKRRIRNLVGKVQEQPQATNLELRAQHLAAGFTPRSISNTNVIEVAQKGSDPEWTARFVNDLLDQHIKHIAKKNEEARQGTFYLEQRNLSYVRWNEAQDALTDFRKKYGADLLAGDEEHLSKVLSQLEADLVETGTRVLENQAKVDFLQYNLENLPDTIAAESTLTESETVRLLKQSILELQIKRTELLSRYTPTSTRIRDMDRQIEHALTMLDTTQDQKLEEVMTAINPAYQTLELDRVQTEARLVASQARLDALQQQIDLYRDKLSRLELLSTELQRLKNDVETKQKRHQDNLQKEEDARYSRYLDESGIVNLAIWERAEPPVTPEPSKSKIVVAAGLIAGLALGVVLAFVRDFLDPTVKGSAQAYRLATTPILAEIPRR